MAAAKQKDNRTEKDQNELESERTERASEAFCQACQDSGVSTASWEDFNGHQEYVEGKINDAKLAEQAQAEMSDFSRSFGKYLVIAQEEPTQRESSEKKDRIRQANKIYRETCRDQGMIVCFFKDFSTWSDFVEGRIEESQFIGKAKEELAELMAKEK
jgi:hypothetical protein